MQHYTDSRNKSFRSSAASLIKSLQNYKHIKTDVEEKTLKMS